MTPAPSGREGGRHPRPAPNTDADYAERLAKWGGLNASGRDIGFRAPRVTPALRADLLAALAAILTEDQARREELGQRLFAVLRAAGSAWADVLPFYGTPPATIDFDSVPSLLSAIDRAHASAFDFAVIAVVAAKPLHSAADLAAVREVFARCHHRANDERKAPLARGDF